MKLVGLEREYDDAGQVIKEYDAYGHGFHFENYTSFEHDGLGRLIKVTGEDPDESGSLARPVTEYEYDLVGNLTKVIDPLLNETEYAYDNLNRRTSTTDSLSGVTSFTYDAVGNLLTLTDPVGNVTEWTYDGLNRVTVEMNELDDARSFEYDANGNLIRRTDRNGRVIEYTYDRLGRLVEERWLDSMSETGLATATVATTVGGVAAVNEVQNVGVSTTGSLTGGTFTLSYNGQTTGALNAASNVQAALEGLSTIGAGNVTVVKTVNLATEQRWQVTFTGGLAGTDVGQITIDTSNVTATAAKTDIQSTVTAGVAPVNEKQTIALDQADDGTFTVTYASQTTGNLAEDVSAGALEAALEALSNIDNVAVTYVNGAYVIEFLGGLSGTDVAAMTTNVANVITTDRRIRSTYDANSRLTAIKDHESALAYAYDALNRVTSVNNSGTPGFPVVVLSNEYDARSLRTGVSATINSVADFRNIYAYDRLGQMTSVTQEGQTGGNGVAKKKVDFAYNLNGMLETITRNKDVSGVWTPVVQTSFGYDPLERLVGMTHTKSSDSSTLVDYDWTYDAASRITAFTNSAHTSENVTYSYDNTNQVVGADRSGSTSDESWDWDPNGNREDTGYGVGDNNKMTTDGTYNYEYDDEGNRTAKVNIATGERIEYVWDFRNRLDKVVWKNSGGTVTKSVDYRYDVFNRRIAKLFDNDGDGDLERTEGYAYDGDHVALVFADADGDGPNAGALIKRILHGPAIDQVLAEEKITTSGSAGDTYWQLGDNLGSVRDIADNTGAVVNHITYDTFGNIASETAPAVDHRFGFTGREHDVETGMRYHRARYFDNFQWISEDPIGFEGDPSNLYRYVSNIPPLLADPTGLDASIDHDGGDHTGIQVEIRDKNGKFIGILTADFAAGGYMGTPPDQGCFSNSITGATGYILIGFRPNATLFGDRKVPGTTKQDDILIDWILSKVGKNRAWLNGLIAGGKTQGFVFKGRGGFQTYRVLSNNCNDFTDAALDKYLGYNWIWEIISNGVDLIEQWDERYDADGNKIPPTPADHFAPPLGP